MSTNKLCTTRFAIKFFFGPTSRSSQEREGFFSDKLHTRARTWKPLSPPGLVCRQKKRGREKEKKKTKDGGLSPQEGDVRKKKRNRPRKARRGLHEGKVPCVLNQDFFFGSRVFGFGSSPSHLKYRLLRDLVYEEAMCKGSSGNGLPYAAKAVPKKDYFTHLLSKSSTIRATLHRLKILLQSIRSEEGPHYRLSKV